MTDEQDAKIVSAMVACLEVCRDSETPYTNLTRFMGNLSKDPAWSLAEVVESQTRVIRLLLYRQKNPEPPVDPAPD